MSLNETAKALSQITDAGLFERLATSVLRSADIKYAELSHSGVNADGKTVKSPIDGFLIEANQSPTQIIAVHHTIARHEDLERKWLFDPVSSNKKKPTTPAGDVIKTAAVISKYSEQFPDRDVHLILTTNEDPKPDLIASVKARGIELGLQVEFWSRSRIADFLDNNPDGQWLRSEFFNANATRLSSPLLRSICTQSLENLNVTQNDDTHIKRDDTNLLDGLGNGLHLVSGESGFGKSTACLEVLTDQIELGNFSLVLPHQMIDAEPTLERAVISTLIQYHPYLREDSSPFVALGSGQTLNILVEDLNRANDPSSLLRKLSGWCIGKDKPHMQQAKILCPIWPEKLSTLDLQTREKLQANIVDFSKFSEPEGTRAVLSRSEQTKTPLSEYDAEQIARDLSFDPLLIALHDLTKNSASSIHVIKSFSEDALERIQERIGTPSSDLHEALTALGDAMLRNRKLEVTWKDVKSWGLSDEELTNLRHILKDKTVMQLIGSSSEQTIRFRHDRIRDSILVDAMCELETSQPDDRNILFDPYFSHLSAIVLEKQKFPSEKIALFRENNPLTLFYALKLTASLSTERSALIETINDLAKDGFFDQPESATLCWLAERELERTNGPEIPSLVARLVNIKRLGSLAALRNGDVIGGLPQMQFLGPGVTAPFRDQQIEHAKTHHLDVIISELERLLEHTDLTSNALCWVLSLCGFIGDPSLANALAASWSRQNKGQMPVDLLKHFLWANSMCCDDQNAAQLLDPICVHWDKLPDMEDGGVSFGTKNDLAANSIRFAFRRTPPTAAIKFFTKLAESGKLKWPIVYMLHECNQWDALYLVIRYLSEMRKEGTHPYLNILMDPWSRRRTNSQTLSKLCRDKLREIFIDPYQETDIRKVALRVWASRNVARQTR